LTMDLRKDWKGIASGIATAITTFWAVQEIAKNYGVTITMPASYALVLAFVGLTIFPLWVGYRVGSWRNKKSRSIVPHEPPKPSAEELEHESQTVPQTAPRPQGIYGADELLEVLEALESKGHQWLTLIAGAPQEKAVSLVAQEANSHHNQLLSLSVYYTNAWNLTVHNKITIIYRELAEGSSALWKGRIDSGKMHVETALDIARPLIAYLKSSAAS